MERAELTAIVAALFALRRPGGINKMGDHEVDVCVGEAAKIIRKSEEFYQMQPAEREKRLGGKSRDAIDKDKTNLKLPEGAVE